METGLKKGGFSCKAEWTTSYDNNDEEINISGFSSSMLGCFYTPSSDTWTIKANINFSKKIRNLRPAADQINTREELKVYIQDNGLKKIKLIVEFIELAKSIEVIGRWFQITRDCV